MIPCFDLIRLACVDNDIGMGFIIWDEKVEYIANHKVGLSLRWAVTDTCI